MLVVNETESSVILDNCNQRNFVHCKFKPTPMAASNRFQRYQRRHVYHTVDLKSDKKVLDTKPPLPPKPKFVVTNRNKRHIYYTIDCSPTKCPVIKHGAGTQADEHTASVTKEHPISMRRRTVLYTAIPPPVPPRIINEQAIEDRKKLDTEYFENLKQTVGDELLHLAEENDLPILREQRSGSCDEDYLNRYPVSAEADNESRSEASSSTTIDVPGPSYISELKYAKRNILAQNVLVLKKCGWYWGNLSWTDAEYLLTLSSTAGAFLIRDSQDPKHLLTVTARSTIDTIHHIRIEHVDGKFQLYEPGGSVNSSAAQCARHSNIVRFVELAIRHSQLGNFAYFVKPKNMGEPPIQIRLLSPVSRFATVKSLRYNCRLVIRDMVLPYNIPKLPLPNPLIGYLQEPQYYDLKECLVLV